jgi:hypothetical protein
MLLHEVWVSVTRIIINTKYKNEMITERKYRNALLIVKRYQEEQDQIKFSRISCANITSETLLIDLYYTGIITPRLYNILKRNYYEKIGELSEINVDEFRRWRDVGERTINEFLKLKEHGEII